MLQILPTLLTPAGRAYDLAVGSPTSSTLPLSFLYVPGARSYEYSISSTSAVAGFGAWTALASDKIVTGLSGSTQYWVKVRIVNGVARGPASPVVTGTTSAGGGVEPTLTAAVRIALDLDHSVFPVQGPPGAGKTYTGARMICALASDGKRIGVTANSHKVIRNLLDEVIVAAADEGLRIHCIQKVTDREDDLPTLQFTTKNEVALDALSGSCAVGGGTSFFWARPDARLCVDVLFIDEAAQMSLADVLAVSQAAKSIVLLGDPRQLEQPIQGSHPDGVGVSALDHVLGPHATVPPDRGLFLEETWRLHPLICAFNSELFYEGRLKSRPGLERQEIKSNTRLKGAGLRYLPIEHSGNQSSSSEEADAVRDLVSEILGSGTTWVDRLGAESPIALDDFLIIAPYNAQVFELQERLPGARIGTVDKFQG